jgi:hypothetical protein
MPCCYGEWAYLAALTALLTLDWKITSRYDDPETHPHWLVPLIAYDVVHIAILFVSAHFLERWCLAPSLTFLKKLYFGRQMLSGPAYTSVAPRNYGVSPLHYSLCAFLLYGIKRQYSGVQWTLTLETAANLDDDTLLCAPTCGDTLVTSFQNRIALHDLDDGALLCTNASRTERNMREVTLGFPGQNNRTEHVCVGAPSHSSLDCSNRFTSVSSALVDPYIYMYDTVPLPGRACIISSCVGDRFNRQTNPKRQTDLTDRLDSDGNKTLGGGSRGLRYHGALNWTYDSWYSCLLTEGAMMVHSHLEPPVLVHGIWMIDESRHMAVI